MHRTDTLHLGIVLRGEIYCILDEEEILLKPFDTVVILGSNHGWSNRGAEPCLLVASCSTPSLTTENPRDN
jgi:quercetin dioxygenase-like cupin family protein